MPPANPTRPTIPEIMFGSGAEVSGQLRRTTFPLALAIAFEDDDRQLAYYGLFRQVATFLPRLISQRRKDKLDRIVDALLPDIETSVESLAPIRVLVDARISILRSGDFLRVRDIARLAGYSATNPSAQPNKWKRDRIIFAVRHKGVDYFPRYALDSMESYRPYKALADVLKIFGETKGGWEAAFWFAGLNSLLDDRRPQDLLATRPDLVIAAAQDEVDGVQHG